MKRIPFDLNDFIPRGSFKNVSGMSENFGYRDISGALEGKLNDYKLDKTTKLKHAAFLFIFLLAACMVFILRSLDLQYFGGQKYKLLAEANRTRYAQIQPERGVIYDRNGEVLARNRPAFSVELNTMYCVNVGICESTLSQVESVLGQKFPEAYEDLKVGRQIITVADGLNKESVLPLESRLALYPGLVVKTQPVRDYLYPESFSHVLGYIGLDDKTLQPKFVGKTGLEESYEEYLQGIPGEQVIQVDSTGQSYKVVAEQNSLPGKSIYTYLDKNLQLKAYSLLKQKITDDKKATAGVVVAQDPNTGGIIALVSYPAFDSNKLSHGIDPEELRVLLDDPSYPFFNRSISAVYPPGSTFKMVTASGALEEGVVTANTTIFDPGYIQIGSFIFRNWKLSGHGEVNLFRALQVSNDTYFYTVGGGYGSVGGLGIEKLSSWAGKYGYGKLTGIDMTGEVAGNMPDGKARAWYLGDTYITAIGQGDVLSTPLQVNQVTTYFANGGVLYVPRVVKTIDGVGNTETSVLEKDLISQKNYDLIRSGLLAVASPGGTAYPFFDFPQKHNGVKVGAKTGTSEFTDSSGQDKTHAWLTVFGPFEQSESDHAPIALTVFLEGGGAGSDDASPIARELMDLWFSK